MKKSLLLLSSVVMSLGAFAQNFTATWERPAAPEFASFVTDSACYMWNVGAGGFYINHQGAAVAPYYGTAASVNDTIGALVKITRTNPNDKITEDFSEGTENSYLLVDYVTKFKEFRCSFADGWVWTDNNEQAYRFFDVNVTDKKFTITPNRTLISGAGANIADTWVDNPIGVKADDAEKMVRISATGEEWYTEWAFVSQETYASYIESAKNQLVLYSAATALRKTIEKAISENPGLNLDEQVAVYNNTNSTAEELNAAKEAIPAAIVAFTASKASIDNPVNYSTLITNSTFDTVGDFTGWSAGFGAGGTKGPNAEVYGKSFDVYQTIKNIPNGVYMAKVNAFMRKDNTQADYDTYMAGTPASTIFYAKSGDITSSVNVKHVCEGSVLEAMGVSTEMTYTDGEGTTHYCPNTMLAADSYFHNADGSINPRYENTVYVPVSNGEITIGAASPNAGSADWSIFDDFQLYYIGDADASYSVLKDNLVENVTYDLPDNGAYSKKDYDEYTNLYNALVNAVGKNAITEYTVTKQALDSLKASVESYSAYITAVNNAKVWYDEALELGINDDIESVAMVDEYLLANKGEATFDFPNGIYSEIIDEKTGAGKLTNAQIIAETDYVNALVKKAQLDGIFEDADLTSMITNPGFEEAGGKGWTNSYGALTNWHGGNANNYCAEAWNSNFNVYQDVEGLANGLYEVSVQAFYRTASNATAYDAYNNDPDMVGDAKVLSYVYFNDFATPIRNVMEIQYVDNLSNNCYATPGGKYTLNGMTSASTAFSMEDEEMNFTMKVYGIVTDGKMRLGIRNTEGSVFDRWTLWDNFKLRYKGKNKIATASALKLQTNILLNLLVSEKDNMNTVTKSFIDNNVAPAVELVGGINEITEKSIELLDKDELWNTLASLASVQTEAMKDIEAYKNFKNLYSNIEEISTDNFTDAMRAEFYEIQDLSPENMTREELLAANSRMTADLEWFKFPARVENASEDNIPEVNEETVSMDFTSIIANPSFEDGLNSWNSTGTGNFKSQNNEAFAKTGEKYCEQWHVDAFLNINQTIKNLPAGYYTLSADCYNQTADACLYILVESVGDKNIISSEKSTYIEISDDALKQQNYSVTNYFDGNGIVTFGYKGTLTGSTWMCIDNVTVTYTKDAPTTSIDAINASAAKAETSIYAISGTRINSLRKGINIVKMADGTVKKFIVK